MPAPRIRNSQLSPASRATLPPTTTRSCRNNRRVRSGGGADDAMAGKVDVGELTVAVGEGDLHWAAGRAARSAADIGDLIFEACRQPDLRTRFFASHLVADRLPRHLEIARDR